MTDDSHDPHALEEDDCPPDLVIDPGVIPDDASEETPEPGLSPMPATTYSLVSAARTAPQVDMRPDWGARPPLSMPGGFRSLNSTVCHFVGASRGYVLPESANHDRCRAQVRGLQAHAQTIPGMSDIHYNACVCVHGVVFEGRVLGQRSGANGTADSNATEPSVCALLGVDDPFTQRMLDGLAWFHQQVEHRAGRSLVMRRHGQVVSTSCPGSPLGRWVDSGGWRTPVAPPPPPPPIPEEENDMIVRQRWLGYWNEFLMGAGGAEHLTPETAQWYIDQGVPLVVSQPHPQSLRSVLFQTGLTAADLVPSTEIEPWFTG